MPAAPSPAVVALPPPHFTPAEVGALHAARVRLAAAARLPVSLTLGAAEAGGIEEGSYATLAIDTARGEADAWEGYAVLGTVIATRRSGGRFALVDGDGCELARGNSLLSVLDSVPSIPALARPFPQFQAPPLRRLRSVSLLRPTS